MPAADQPPRAIAWLPIGAAWLLVVLAVVYPGASAAWRIATGLASDGGVDRAAVAAAMGPAAWARLGLTLGLAALIGTLAMALAAAPAWLVARRRSLWAAVFLTPLLLPAYLAYAGWGMVRAPRTALAAWLEGPATELVPNAPVVAGQVVAVLGLVLWAWPLAMLGASPGLAGIDQDVLDDSRLSLRGWRAARMRLRLSLLPLLAGAGVVALVMLGSAVPLHLAQIETDAIRLWRLLDQVSAQGRWTAWVGAWPTISGSAVAGVLLARGLGRGWSGWSGRSGRSGTGAPAERLRVVGVTWSLGIWALSVLGPLVLFAASIRERSSLGSFWRLQGGGVRDSVMVGAGVGLVGSALVMAIAYGLSAEGRPAGTLARATRWLLAPLLVAAILPGVLVGSATLDAWSRMGDLPWAAWVADSPAIVGLTHLCRFGAVAALAGVWLARSEPLEVAALRAIDGATGPLGWAKACPGSTWLVAAGTGVAMALLSLHEIESAVIVQPPGLENLARHLLSLLHFSRDEQLSAAAVWLIGLGVLPAAGAALALVLGGRRRRAEGALALQPSGRFPETISGSEPDPRGRR